MNSPDLHVIFGTGPLGLAVMRTLLARGKSIRMVNRKGKAEVPVQVEMVKGDATDQASVRQVCDGATVVYHCANAPYARWPQELPPIFYGILKGAAAVGARLVYGDNLYMYGPVTGPLTEDLPYRATGRNGRTRAQLAAALMEAHRIGQVQATIGRASNFFGPYARDSIVGDGVFAAALAGKPARILGNPDTLHTYTFIDDFAKGLVTLGEREEALGETWHIPSAETVTTRQFIALVFAERGAPPQLCVAPKLGMTLLALVNPVMRAVKEQLYQSEQPVVVDHSKYARAFGVEVTPHREAIRQTLDWFRKRPTA